MKLPSEKEMQILESLGSAELSGKDILIRYRGIFRKDLPIGTLYTTLRRLKTSGWIDSKKEDEDVDGRFRLFFMTGPGSKAMSEAHAARSAIAAFGRRVS